MADRYKFARARQEIIDALRKDLLGPQSEEEILDESPKSAYIVGVLSPQTQEDRTATVLGDQEVDTDVQYDDNEYISGEDDNEPVSVTHFTLPSSIGISFYVKSDLPSICADVSWGDYIKSREPVEDKEGNEKEKTVYKRIPMSDTVLIIFSEVGRSKEYRLFTGYSLYGE